MTKSVAKLVKAIEKAEKTEESPAPAKKAKRKANGWAMFLKEEYVLQKEKDPKVKFSDVMKSAETKSKWAKLKSK
jgi:ATP-dependent Zn protease